MAGGSGPPHEKEARMTSPAQVDALFRALYGLPETIALNIVIMADDNRSVIVGVLGPDKAIHSTRTSIDNPDPLTALRTHLIECLVARELFLLTLALYCAPRPRFALVF